MNSYCYSFSFKYMNKDFVYEPMKIITCLDISNNCNIDISHLIHLHRVIIFPKISKRWLTLPFFPNRVNMAGPLWELKECKESMVGVTEGTGGVENSRWDQHTPTVWLARKLTSSLTRHRGRSCQPGSEKAWRRWRGRSRGRYG